MEGISGQVIRDDGLGPTPSVSFLFRLGGGKKKQTPQDESQKTWGSPTFPPLRRVEQVLGTGTGGPIIPRKGIFAGEKKKNIGRKTRAGPVFEKISGKSTQKGRGKKDSNERGGKQTRVVVLSAREKGSR